MAQKVQILLVDDLDGGSADETVTFAVDGVTYEIDLAQDKAEKLRKFLSPYTSAGRRTGGRATHGKATKALVNSDTAKIRAWAKSNGYDVNDRGRVPADIRDAYDEFMRKGTSQDNSTTAPASAAEKVAAPAAAPTKKAAATSPPAKKTSAAGTAKKTAAKKTAAVK